MYTRREGSWPKVGDGDGLDAVWDGIFYIGIYGVQESEGAGREEFYGG